MKLWILYPTCRFLSKQKIAAYRVMNFAQAAILMVRNTNVKIITAA